MKTLSVTSLYTCGHCKRQLPPEAFYTVRKTQRSSNYCKECRKAISRRQRTAEKTHLLDAPTLPLSYPVITDIEEKEFRMRLIMKAIRFVRESVERKRRNEALRMMNEE